MAHKNQRLILIVEDESDAAELLQFQLRRRGHRPVVASDGLRALDIALDLKPDLIILDLMLPFMNGLEVCRLVKLSPAARHIPVLMLTARASAEDKLRGFDHGADDYLTKPFEMGELLARVESLLRRRAPSGFKFRSS